ncbi:MAG: methyltransferase domain-containing protein, partial [Pseudonocardiaceae bacterium]
MSQHSEPLTSPGSAAARWRELLQNRAIPPEIRAAAPKDPSRHDPARFVPPDTPEDTPSRRAALQLLLPDGGTVLDVGCGAGAAGLALVSKVSHLTGVDPAEDMLRAFEQACQQRGLAHRSVHGPW